MSELIRIPSTNMGYRYLKVQAEAPDGTEWEKGERIREQLRLAKLDASPDGSVALAADFLESIDRFDTYEPRQEPFYPKKRERLTQYERKESPDAEPSTSRLAAAIEEEDERGEILGVETEMGLPDLLYLDRELVASRTSSPSEYEDSAGTVVRLDLLFSATGKPAIAEVKAGGDENVYYALIQGLASCAQLAPEKQRQRLSREYPALSEDGPLELWIVLFEHNSRGEEKREMVGLANEIAEGLMSDDRVTEHLGAIRCVEANLPASGPVTMAKGELGWSVVAKH